MLRRAIVRSVLRPIIRAEVPGWGHLYKAFIGSRPAHDFWDGTPPAIMRDNRCGYYRIVNMAEWTDRILYFLGRWYDLESSLVVEALIEAGDRVLDVGANYGHFSLAAAKAVGAAESVISFEPNPKAFTRLSVHLDLNGLTWVEANNIGVSDAGGRLALSVPIINSGEASFGTSKYEEITVVEVDVRTLDDVVGDREVNFIKIDVEGFEAHVLRGAMRIIERDQPWILTEVVDSHLNGAGESRKTLSELMHNAGYKAYRLGLRGAGGRQRLRLEDILASEVDGDFLWVPPSKLARLAPLLR